MNYTEWDDVKYGKYYVVYEYAKISHMGLAYKGVVIWKYTEDLTLDVVDHMVGSSPIGCHCARSEASFTWKYWEISDKPLHTYTLKYQPTLVFFELSEDDLMRHAVLEVI